MSSAVLITSSQGSDVRSCHRIAPERRIRSRATGHQVWRRKMYFDARGKYRVFNEEVYRFYRSNTATPPAEGDTPYATAQTLPATPATTFANGTWLISVSYFNGVIDSGFLPLGPNGETYLKLIVAGGVETGNPPNQPFNVTVTQRAGGVIRVTATYAQGVEDPDHADQWVIVYTTNGSTPAEDTPTATQAIPAQSIAFLEYDIPAQAHGTTVKVRIQSRRNDGTPGVPVWVYSDGSAVLTILADANGPAAPEGAERWAGPLPEDF